MNNFYSPEVSRQLQQLGCVASSGDYLDQDGLLVDEYLARNERNLKDCVPLFSSADFLASPEAKENCIKVFGDKYIWEYDGQDANLSNNLDRAAFEDPYEQAVFYAPKHYAHQLLDIILSGGDGESFIKEALEEHDQE